MGDKEYQHALDLMMEGARADERKKTLEYLVNNGYIKYGFNVKYLLDVMKRGGMDGKEV